MKLLTKAYYTSDMSLKALGGNAWPCCFSYRGVFQLRQGREGRRWPCHGASNLDCYIHSHRTLLWLYEEVVDYYHAKIHKLLLSLRWISESFSLSIYFNFRRNDEEGCQI